MKARVLLAVEPEILRDALSDTLERSEGVELVGEVDDPVDLLLAVEETRADVVLQSFPTPEELPAICGHLFAEYPYLRVIGLSPNGGPSYVCEQKVSVRPLPEAGIEELLSEIRKIAPSASNDQ